MIYNEFTIEVCKALGLDAHKVTELHIHIGLLPPVKVDVKTIGWDVDLERMVETLRQYDFQVTSVTDNSEGVE